LRGEGYDILVQNYRTKVGEIDIVAREGDVLVFVEVKARKSAKYGDPKWAVTRSKQRKISMAALYYLKTTGQSRARARFDVLTIQPGADGRPVVEIVRNAFGLAYG
jgi:putative endonuclease